MIFRGFFLAAVALTPLLAQGTAHAQTLWINPDAGTSAGDWFDVLNWNTAALPNLLTDTAIDNGGEAKALAATATGILESSGLDVGKNGGAGILTVDGIDVQVFRSLDIGEVEGSFATGPVTVTSSGSASIRNAVSLIIGTGGGDLDVGQVTANSGATASGNGTVTIDNVQTIDVTDDVDVGETGGSADAEGTGVLTISTAGSFHVGQNVDVGETGSSSGTKIAHGTLNIDHVTQILLDGDLDLGRTFSAGGQDDGTGNVAISDSGTITIGGGLTVGLAGAQAGGSATSFADLRIERSGSISVAEIFGIGHVRNTLGSGTATSNGSAALIDVGAITIGQDIFVGRNFTRDDVTGMATGSLTIERADSVQINNDLDVGQTGTTGVSVSGIGTAHGNGVVVFRDVTGAITIGGAADIGNATAVAQTTATGFGDLTIERAGSFGVMGDLNVGQTAGAGQATGTGFVTILDTQTVTIGEDLDVGSTSGSAAGPNQGSGIVVIRDAELSVGFANALIPGSFNLGNATALPGETANASGVATLTRVDLDVANRINVGELAGGSASANNSASGTLHAIDSSLTARQLDVAMVSGGTEGTADGTLEVESTLVSIAGPTNFGPDATLVLHLAGTTRADGLGGPGEYSAIDAETALLAGELQVLLDDGFEPSAGDSFVILAAVSSITNTFETELLPSLDAGLSWNIDYGAMRLQLQVIASFVQADFDEDGDVDGDDFLAWQSGFGIPTGATHSNGDADADGDVDGDDFLLWQSQFGSASGSSAGQASIPEPRSAELLVLLIVFAFLGLKGRHVKAQGAALGTAASLGPSPEGAK